MTLSTVRLGLLVGAGAPTAASAQMMSALESVEVHQSDDGPAGFGQGFQLTFRAERGTRAGADFALVSERRLQPGCRVVITVTVNAKPRVLMDGVICDQQFDPVGGDGTGRFTVSGSDLSVLMDMVEISVGYPALDHVAIVAFVLAKYVPLGVAPFVVPPIKLTRPLPTERVPFQTGTDRSYLRELARAHGYVFGVKPGPVPLASVAYWGPRVKVGLPQRALSVDMGHATNVRGLQFSNAALAPEQVYGTKHLIDKTVPIPFATLASLSLPLSSRPALLANQPFVRKVRHEHQPGSFIDTLEKAQGRTNESSDGAVTARGTLDVLRYQDVLAAPGIVGVRGAGRDYDGLYYVQSVQHRIEQGAYTQDFTLQREGLGAQSGSVRA